MGVNDSIVSIHHLSFSSHYPDHSTPQPIQNLTDVFNKSMNRGKEKEIE